MSNAKTMECGNHCHSHCLYKYEYTCIRVHVPEWMCWWMFDFQILFTKNYTC